MKLSNCLLGVVVLAVAFSFSACATVWEELRPLDGEREAKAFERSNVLFAKGDYEGAFKENEKVLSQGDGQADVALFNMGLITAYSLNSKKDYPKALVLFRQLIKDYPQSPLAEQARVWIQVLEEHQRITDEKQKLAETKRTLTREKETLARERELLSQERETLKHMIDKSRQVDIEIEKRKRKTRTK